MLQLHWLGVNELAIWSDMRRIDLGKLDITEDDLTVKLEDMILPSQVEPLNIKEYPKGIEISERMRRVCKNRMLLLQDKMQVIEDRHYKAIDEETVIVTLGRKGYLPEHKQKYSSEVKRQRELRIRLADDAEYQKLKARKQQYDEARARWVTHGARLRQELRQLEVDYASNGGMGVGL